METFYKEWRTKGINSVNEIMAQKSKNLLLLTFILLTSKMLLAQSVAPVNSRYAATQKGNIVFVSNNILSCNGAAPGCSIAQYEMPPAGTSSNTAYTMQYIDVDGDATTFSSSSADLSLASCSQITFAGLYWGASITGATTNYSSRNVIKLKLPGGTLYSSLTADTLIDNATGANSYHCYKNITSQVAAAGNGTYTVADFVAATGTTGNFGGWTIVVAYKNENMAMKQLTVFDGLFNSNATNTLTRSLTGFTTATTGNIGLEVGVISYNGSRAITGDSLLFNDAVGTYVSLKNTPNPENNIFNSSITYNGTSVATRNPAYTNTLGYDADIIIANNSTKNYITNSQTSANIKVISASEQVLTQVITTSLDVAMPNLRLIKSYTDINGGTIDAGDTILYTISAINDGSRSATSSYFIDTIPSFVTYIPGSLNIVTGPNAGIKTDASNDDQAEYITGKKLVRFRLGTSATATKGGIIASTGLIVTTVTFKVKISPVCETFLCTNQISNRAYGSCTPNAGTGTYNALSQPPGTNASGCQLTGPTILAVAVPSSCTSASDTTVAACAPYYFSSLNTVHPGFTYYNSGFTKVTGASSSGIFYAIKKISAACADTFVVHYTSNNPGITGTTLTQPTCTNGGAYAGRIRANGINATDSIAYCIGSTFTGGTFALGSSLIPANTITGLNQNQYTIRIKSNTNCFVNRTVNISYINCTPVTTDEYYTILATDILDNDVSLNDNEPDADPMTFTLVTPPVNGSLVFNSDGSFTYTPNPTFRGTETFVYRGSDNRSPSLGSDAVVHITIVSPLPVEMTWFNTSLEKSKVVSAWQTASELNNDHFDVERSSNITDGFIKIGTVQGNGSTNIIHNYSFIDEKPLQGRSYYRLRQVDHNNDFNYSKVNSVDNGTMLSQEIIPNPNNGVFKLHLNSNTTGNLHISVVSQYGQRCYSEDIKMEVNLVKEINLKENAKGVYYIILTQNETVSKLKLVVQ